MSREASPRKADGDPDRATPIQQGVRMTKPATDAPPQRPLYILVARPLGEGGKGGIDRMMDALADELRRLSDPAVQVRFGATRGPGSILVAPFYLAVFLARLIVLRGSGRCDLVHINLSSHGSTWRKLVVAVVAHVMGIPYVLHLNGSRYRHFWSGASAPTQRTIARLFCGAARVVVTGTVWRDFVAERAPGARITIVPNATHADDLPDQQEQGAVTLLFLGRLGARKGVPQLIEALGRLGAVPGWRAILAGDGDVVGTAARIADLGLRDRVDVPGWVGPEAVADLMARSDILVLPSFDENLPMSVIEGMAAGLAVVATPVGAVEDIIEHGRSGLLVAPGDVEALTSALGRLIADPALRQRLGQAGRAFQREHLEIEGYARRLVRLWREAASRPVCRVLPRGS